MIVEKGRLTLAHGNGRNRVRLEVSIVRTKEIKHRLKSISDRLLDRGEGLSDHFKCYRKL